jgi:hypothetical protein
MVQRRGDVAVLLLLIDVVVGGRQVLSCVVCDLSEGGGSYRRVCVGVVRSIGCYRASVLCTAGSDIWSVLSREIAVSVAVFVERFLLIGSDGSTALRRCGVAVAYRRRRWWTAGLELCRLWFVGMM